MERSMEAVGCTHEYYEEEKDDQGRVFRCKKCLKKTYKQDKNIFGFDELGKTKKVFDEKNSLLD